tara:strand:+ start:19423 stop:20121 length:699 start_codon:yes stop_codon:yes gene_type:complete
VKTQLAENFGAVARSMENFNFTNLRLVHPKFDLNSEKILPLAAGASKVLRNVSIFNSLEEAVSDFNFLIGFTARNRTFNKKFISIDDGMNQIIEKFSHENKIAIIFGPENSGLSNNDLTLIDRLITIKSNPIFSSINLSHAVILFCYEWSKFINQNESFEIKSQKKILAKKEDLLNFFHRLELLLSKSGFIKTKQRKKTITTKLKNIFNRMDLTKNELDALMGIINSLYKSK